MTDCLNDQMRDQLPLLALGALSGADEVAVRAHVATCASCRAELEAIGHSRRVLDAVAPAVDVATIVAALPAPHLRVVAPDHTAVQPKPGRAPWMTRSYLAAAASLLIVASLASPYLMRMGDGPKGAGVPDSSVSVVPRGATSTVPTATTVSSTPAPASTALAVDGGLSDISDDDLRTLLAELESLEATIAVEPATIRAPIVEGSGTF
ncbi:MAG: zf-HC2 domain-containing protein [Gemmatimonadota bacterium]|nr:zf-HC2 domain-containing protein [Gemmatimonadota bacterium]